MSYYFSFISRWWFGEYHNWLYYVSVVPAIFRDFEVLRKGASGPMRRIDCHVLDEDIPYVDY